MSELLLMSGPEEDELRNDLIQFAEEWECSLKDIPGGYLLLPDYMLRIHGLMVVRDGRGWRFSRDPEATTWEDFLLMNLTHRLASARGGTLYYAGGGNDESLSGKPIPPAPEDFETFDHYAERVVRNASDLVKEMKKNWVYTHRKRHVR